MKLKSILLIAALAPAGMAAQTLNINEASVTYNFNASETGVMEFGENHTLTVMGRAFVLDSSTGMWVGQTTVEDNVVAVVYKGEKAEVTVAGNIARYVDVTVSGADVAIVQSDEVSADTSGEITYRLSGESADGSFSMSGSFKATVELAGLNLTSSRQAPIDIQNGKRIALRLTDDTNNRLVDGKGGSQKGCIVCKGHLEFKGKGVLTVTGNTSHAIYAKEYIEMANCTINVDGAVKDGVNCNQYFTLKSGALTIVGVGDDGIQVSYKDDSDREDEDTGAVNLKGGTLNVTVSADAAKGVKCEGAMTVSGGDITIVVTGNGVWDSAKSKTKASACLGSDADILISGGKLNLKATGGGGKGINCDGALTITAGTIDIATSGGIVAYVNNTLNNNYTGNTDRIDSNLKSSPKGIKADGNIDIKGGDIKVTTTGKGAEGIESKSVLTVYDGNITVNATDDAINSSSHMYIKGGNITVIATGNDGLDSNGNLYIEGGYIMAFGSGAPECGIDANEEEGYTVIFRGGTLLAVGGGNSVPSSSSGSTQPFVKGNSSVSANSTVTLSDSLGAALATFTVPADYKSSGGSVGPGGRPGGSSGSSIVITCPGLTNGSRYTLSVGTSSSSVTAALTGSNWPR